MKKSSKFFTAILFAYMTSVSYAQTGLMVYNTTERCVSHNAGTPANYASLYESGFVIK